MTKNKVILIYSVLILILVAGHINLEISSSKEIDQLHNIISKNNEIYRSMLEDNYETMAQDRMLIHGLNLTIDRLQDNIRIIEKKNVMLEHELELSIIKYDTEYDINMRPRYDEVIDFLKEDDTSKKRWTKEYDCTQFSHEVVRNAISSGIFACEVTIDIDTKSDGKIDAGHDIIAFNTTDAGIIYVEPQNDKRIYMSTGMNWCTFTNGGDCENNIIIKYDSCFEMVEE